MADWLHKKAAEVGPNAVGGLWWGRTPWAEVGPNAFRFGRQWSLWTEPEQAEQDAMRAERIVFDDVQNVFHILQK